MLRLPTLEDHGGIIDPSSLPHFAAAACRDEPVGRAGSHKPRVGGRVAHRHQLPPSRRPTIRARQTPLTRYSGLLCVTPSPPPAASGLFEGLDALVAPARRGDSTARCPPRREAKLRASCSAFHVDHQLRGVDGHRDARRRRRTLAAALGMSFVVRSFPVRQLRRPGESLESAARRLRYESLLALGQRPWARDAPGDRQHPGRRRPRRFSFTSKGRLGRSRGGVPPEGPTASSGPSSLSGARSSRFPSAEEVSRLAGGRRLEHRRAVRQEPGPPPRPAGPRDAGAGVTARSARARRGADQTLDGIDSRVDAALAADAAPLPGRGPGAPDRPHGSGRPAAVRPPRGKGVRPDALRWTGSLIASLL